MAPDIIKVRHVYDVMQDWFKTQHMIMYVQATHKICDMVSTCSYHKFSDVTPWLVWRFAIAKDATEPANCITSSIVSTMRYCEMI